MKRKSKPSKSAWFKAVRRSYLPASPEGLVIYLVYVAYEVLLMVDWYRQGHSYGRLLTTILPLAIGASVLTQFIAARNSR